MSAFNRDNSYMTAKQAELHNMRMRSQESRYPTSSSFQDQHKHIMNPEIVDNVSRQQTKTVSDFSLVAKEQQFQRIKSSDAAHEISQVMQAAAKSQREATANAQKHQMQAVQPPKVIPGPQIMGKGNSKIDISHVQAYLNNLKLQNAAASASHSNSTGGLKINQQST